MEANYDVTRRRRRTPIISSGYRENLLGYNTNAPYSRSPRNGDHQLVLSSYQPPTAHESSKGNQEPLTTSLSQYHDEHVDSMLYLSTPKKPQSSIRNIQPKTPARTLAYNTESSTNYNGTSIDRHPAYDYGSNSFFSYGCCCIQCVRTTEVGIVENFGRFEALLDPGLHCIPWPLIDISARLSLRIRQLDVSCETKTSDNVFCNVVVTLLFRVIVEKAYDAYYRLTDPTHQIQSYVFDVIRSQVPKMTLDEVFASKADIAIEVQKRLNVVLHNYGYEIIDSLVTNVTPADSVVQSMNEINAAKRIKIAMVYKAEAEKIKRVKEAEAHCESLYLHGVGVSSQRQVIAKEMKKIIHSSTPNYVHENDVMTLLLMTQYMDMIKTISEHEENVDFIGVLAPEQMIQLKSQIHAL